MKFPKVYVTSQFLEEMDKFLTRSRHSDLLTLEENADQNHESLKRIINLFLASDFKTDISSSDINLYRNSELALTQSFKELLLRKLVRSSSHPNKPDLKTNQKNGGFDQINCCYFLNDSNKICSRYSERYGRIVLGKYFLETPFFLNHSFSVESTSKNIPQAKRIAHPCSSLLIIDPYLLQKKDERFQKVDNLIKFFEIFMPRKLKKPFEIDIITFDPNKENIDRLNSKISEKLGVSFSLHIYYPPSYVYKESDRYFVTDYSITVIGHPLDRESYISNNFIPSNHSTQGIEKGMELWYKKIKGVKNMINKINSDENRGLYSWKSENVESKKNECKPHEIEHSIFKI